jgi:hypothetical protein
VITAGLLSMIRCCFGLDARGVGYGISQWNIPYPKGRNFCCCLLLWMHICTHTQSQRGENPLVTSTHHCTGVNKLKDGLELLSGERQKGYCTKGEMV